MESVLIMLKQATHKHFMCSDKSLCWGEVGQERRQKSQYNYQCLCQESDQRALEGPSLFLLEDRSLLTTISILQVSLACVAQLWATCLGKTPGWGSRGIWGHGEQEENSTLGSLVLNSLTPPTRFCFLCIGQGAKKHHHFAPKSWSEPAQESLCPLHVGDEAENKIWEKGGGKEQET